MVILCCVFLWFPSRMEIGTPVVCAQRIFHRKELIESWIEGKKRGQQQIQMLRQNNKSKTNLLKLTAISPFSYHTQHYNSTMLVFALLSLRFGVVRIPVAIITLPISDCREKTNVERITFAFLQVQPQGGDHHHQRFLLIPRQRSPEYCNVPVLH